MVTMEKTDSRLQHIDYGYSSTSFAAQGETNKTVIAAIGKKDRLSGDAAGAYVSISRVGGQTSSQEKLRLITDDKAGLKDRFQRELTRTDSALVASRDPEQHATSDGSRFRNNRVSAILDTIRNRTGGAKGVNPEADASQHTPERTQKQAQPEPGAQPGLDTGGARDMSR